MLKVKDKRIIEHIYEYGSCTITLRSTEYIEDEEFKIIVQGFVDDEDDDPPGYTFSAPWEVVQKFGRDVFLAVEDECESRIRGYYIEKYGVFVKQRGEPNASRKTEQHSGSDNGKLPSEVAAENGVGA
ncbi:MAG: hypothetical protein DWQ07_25520 [Chloroflexi bacterium]|nr:MAG: hypothetical protein DWQ07_25520 [Chloroflexota bacterium]MBL1197177.1 hypothetical protein [Chloroflexota bacterium]NOH14472.1 hypothetical protein [Chloroflexota bacterium]